MKKLLYIILLLGLLTSCGPHRMKCGPGRRCLVEVLNEKTKNPSAEGFFYEAISNRFNKFLPNACLV